MASRHERVVLEIDYGRLADAMKTVGPGLFPRNRSTLDAATWEPHDWSEWT